MELTQSSLGGFNIRTVKQNLYFQKQRKDTHPPKKTKLPHGQYYFPLEWIRVAMHADYPHIFGRSDPIACYHRPNYMIRLR